MIQIFVMILLSLTTFSVSMKIYDPWSYDVDHVSWVGWIHSDLIILELKILNCLLFFSKFKSGTFNNYESEEEGSSHGEREEEDDIIYEVGVPEAAASMMEVEMKKG